MIAITIGFGKEYDKNSLNNIAKILNGGNLTF